MVKIYVNKSDSVASVVEKVLSSSDSPVVLYIPRLTEFASSRNNFLLLKRETDAAGKEVIIESVDDDILELAAISELKAVNPFSGKRRRAVSDIVRVETRSVPARPELTIRAKVSDDETKDESPEEELLLRRTEPIEEEVSVDVDEVTLERKADSEKVKRMIASSLPKVIIEGEERSGLKRFLVATGITVLITAVLTAALIVLPRVTIALDFEKVDWDFVGTLRVSANTEKSVFTDDEIVLRGVSFRQKKNITESYPASGVEFIERKAKGTIIVYNAYSSEPQDIVETTRFMASDGKLFRTDRDVVVPGAEVVDGAIVPSSVETGVVADEPGEEFNIGPVSKFTIPGFKGSPKFDGFYGESKEAITGGFVGEKKVPTEADIDAARDEVTKTLEEAVKAQLFLNLPEEITVIGETYRFLVDGEAIDDVGAEDEFIFTLSGEAILIGFQENELTSIIRGVVEEESEVDLEVKDFNVEYGESQIHEDGEGFTVPVSIQSVWTRPFDEATFRQNSSGKNETELKTLIFSVSGVKSVEVRFWPFWVKTVPEREKRIIIDVK